MPDPREHAAIPLPSEIAQEIADDVSMSDGLATRKLLAMQIDMLETCMCYLGDIAESLSMRTKIPGKGN